MYSIEKLPGVYLVYHGWDMDTPLMDYQLASEVMLSGDSDLSVYDLRPGDMIEDYAGGLVWNRLHKLSLHAHDDKGLPQADSRYEAER